MAQAEDADSIATATRETQEEVGIDLRVSARLLGPLDQVRAITHRGVRPMVVEPFVFVADGVVTPSTSDEVTGTFWLPLSEAASGRLNELHLYKGWFGVTGRFPCWRYESHIIWGLTYDMLKGLLKLI